MVANLRHPDLRPRDIKRILAQKSSDIRWDAGFTAGSEYVYTSLEDAVHRQELQEWLNSKGVAESADAWIITSSEKDCIDITWGEVMREPERIFVGRELMVVSKDLDWRLECTRQSVARFGRWL